MNIVLICLDTYRADCVAATGRSDFIKTPNADRLVEVACLWPSHSSSSFQSAAPPHDDYPAPK